MVTLGALPIEDAYAAIDMDVLVFLLGVMLIAGYLEEARFFEWLAERVVQRATTPRTLLAAIVLLSGLLAIAAGPWLHAPGALRGSVVSAHGRTVEPRFHCPGGPPLGVRDPDAARIRGSSGSSWR